MIESLLQWGADLVLAIQSLPAWLETPMSLITFLGTEEFYLLFMPIIYWCISASLGIRVGAILLVSGSLNTLFKWVFHLPRPYWFAQPVNGLAGESSFGVPSGHSQIPASIWGLMAVQVKKTWFWVLAVVLVFLVGFSRLYLGVHFPHDVLLGWLIGALLVWAFVVLEKPVLAWLNRQTLRNKLLAVFGVSLLLLLLGGLVLLAVGDYSLNPAWKANALEDQPDIVLDPLNYESIITTAAALFGLSAGAILLFERGGFNTRGKWWQYLGRIVVGIAGVLLFWRGLGAFFPDNQDILSYVLRYMRYTLVGLWMAWLAPLTFIRLGLAEKPLKKKKKPHRKVKK
jgi:membrane-associated phospholipid phosphatase